MPQFPCEIFEKPVAKNHKAIQCDKCKLWVHMKHSKINVQTYNLLINNESTWYCLKCVQTVFPFSELNKEQFHSTIQGKKLKCNSNEEVLINKINDIIDIPDITNSQYYNKDEINKAIKHFIF